LSNTDVLVLTADDVEMAALEDVINREAESVAPSVDGSGFRIIRATMVDDQGHEFAVIAARAHAIGGASAANVATRLVTQYEPYCLAMCGICAGNPESVSLGDVLVAQHTFAFDQGKHVVSYDKDGAILKDEHRQAITTFNLDPRWRLEAERFARVSGTSSGALEAVLVDAGVSKDVVASHRSTLQGPIRRQEQSEVRARGSCRQPCFVRRGYPFLD
jgi:nucleoside phosphorylase